MQRLGFNFATEQRNLTAWNPALSFLLLFAGLLAFVYSAWDYRQQMDQNSTLQEQHNKLMLRTQHLHNKTPVSPLLLTQIEQANAIYAQLQNPWEEILSALETARDKTGNGIALLSAKADSTKREIILDGEAKDFASLSAFTALLSDISLFQNVTLVNDQLTSGHAPVVVTFGLRLIWRTPVLSNQT